MLAMHTHHRPAKVLTFSRDAARAMDSAAIHEFGIPSLVLMENAATAIAEVALSIVEKQPNPFVLVCAGPGNNGGDGLAVARKLANRRVPVSILLATPRDKLGKDARTHLTIADRMSLPIHVESFSYPGWSIAAIKVDHGSPTMIIDALLGTGADRPPAPPLTELIREINELRRTEKVHTLSVDIPTGLDADTGEPTGDHELVIRADTTVTLAGLKAGFEHAASRAYTGEVIVGDIGVPIELLERFGTRPKVTR